MQATISHIGRHEIHIKAGVNGHDRGDIAIDDVIVTEGECPAPPPDHFDCLNGEFILYDRVGGIYIIPFFIQMYIYEHTLHIYMYLIHIHRTMIE